MNESREGYLSFVSTSIDKRVKHQTKDVSSLGAIRGFFMPGFREKTESEEREMFIEFTENQKKKANYASILVPQLKDWNENLLSFRQKGGETLCQTGSPSLSLSWWS